MTTKAKVAAAKKKAQVKSMKAQLEAQRPKTKSPSGKYTEQHAPAPSRHVWSKRKTLKQGPNKGKEVWQCELCNKEHTEIITAAPTRPLEGCKAPASERAAIDSLPCENCGEALHHGNRSILTDGRVIHIGCKKAKKVETTKAKPVLAGLPKHKGVKPPVAPPPPPKSKYGDIMACGDFQGRTCIQVKRDVATVTFIPLDTAGLHHTYMAVAKFDERFKPLEKYPVEKACAHYVRYAGDYGATQDVLDTLAQVVNIKPEVADMAKKRLANKNTNGKSSNGNGHKPAKVGSSKPGSGARIRELLMKATPTDKILSIIHKEFPGSKAKASDVAWNRGKLRKDGAKVPEVKG